VPTQNAHIKPQDQKHFDVFGVEPIQETVKVKIIPAPEDSKNTLRVLDSRFAAKCAPNPEHASREWSMILRW